MHRALLLSLSSLIMASCSRASSSAPSSPNPPAAAVSVSPAPSASVAAVASAGPPASLPFCNVDAGVEPLAALCALGADQSKAHFECAAPEPVGFCNDDHIDEWGCRTFAMFGEAAPSVTFKARFDHHGPPMPKDVPMTTKEMLAKFPKQGVIRGVTIRASVQDVAEATRVVAADVARLVSVGCVATPNTFIKNDVELDCKTWVAHVNAVLDTSVYIEADMAKSYRCNP